MLTFPVTLTDVQVIAWVEPTAQLSPPLGEVTVMAGGGGPVIVKSESLVSATAGAVTLVILILAWVVPGPVTTQV